MKTKIFLIGLALLAMSCLDDKTNYDYTLANEVKSIGNIEGSYTFYPGESYTFEPQLRYTLDSVNVGVSYEWYLDMELKSREPKYTLVAEEIGDYRLTLVVTVNNSNLKTASSSFIKVDSEWKKGWLILSENNGVSELSIVKTKTLTLKGDDGYDRRDTLVIVDEDRNINPGLGQGPMKLFEHFAYDDYTTLAHEIVVVQQNKCVELNGYSLEREIYTEEEFTGTVPQNFQPVDVAMTYKSNAVLNKDGYLYYSPASNGAGYHTGRYSSTPWQNGKKISGLAVGRGGKSDFILAIQENPDNTRSIIGIVDQGNWRSEGTFGTSHLYNGELATVPGDESDVDLFNSFTADVIYTGWCGKDPDYGEPIFLSVLKEEGRYYFLCYSFDIGRKGGGNDTYKFVLEPTMADKNPAPDGLFDDLKDIALFPYRDYLIIASGNTLYLVNYKDSAPVKKELKTFSSPVNSLAARDFNDRYDELEGPQVGVGLANGEFYVFEIEKEEFDLKEVYHNQGFGKIVDVIYKYCSFSNFYEGKYY